MPQPLLDRRQLVWIVADRRTGRVHRADGSITIVKDDGSFDGEDVIPGFTCPLAEVT